MNSAERFREYVQHAHVTPQEPVQIDSGKLQLDLDNWKNATIVRVSGIADDPEMLELVAHELRRDETLAEFTARTGLGKATIKAQKMTPSQISSFCLQAEKNSAEETNPTLAPRKVPSKFAL
jgi:hypothetical protein